MTRPMCRPLAGFAGGLAAIAAGLVVALGGPIGVHPALAQNDWQFPDPYFGVPQPANPAAPAIQRRYRTEIGPPAIRRQAEGQPPRTGPRSRRHRGYRER